MMFWKCFGESPFDVVGNEVIHEGGQTEVQVQVQVRSISNNLFIETPRNGFWRSKMTRQELHN